MHRSPAALRPPQYVTHSLTPDEEAPNAMSVTTAEVCSPHSAHSYPIDWIAHQGRQRAVNVVYDRASDSMDLSLIPSEWITEGGGLLRFNKSASLHGWCLSAGTCSLALYRTASCQIPTSRLRCPGGKESVPIITHCGGGGRGQKARLYLEANGFGNVVNGGGPEDEECWAVFGSK